MNTNRRYLYIALLVVFVGFLFLAFVSYASADAKVLPEGTRIDTPDGNIVVLTADYFLLDRTGMEAATTALAQAPIDAKTIEDLRTLSDKQAQRLATLVPWAVVAAVAAAFAGFLAGHLLK